MKKVYLVISVGVISLGVLSVECLSHKNFETQKAIVKAESPRLDNLQQLKTPSSQSIRINQHSESKSNKNSIDDLSLKEVKDAIAQVEHHIEQDHAIERLNSDAMTSIERREMGVQFRKLDRLREREIALHITEIEEDLSNLEKNHASRLEAYGMEKQ